MTQHVLVRDIETRSELDLEDVGIHRYATHPSTRALCVSYAVDDEPVQLWLPRQPIPKVFRHAAKDTNWLTVAHNASFERLIERHVLKFPEVPLERQRCLMAIAMALALPGSLASAAKVLNLTHQKDEGGRRVMLQLARPRKPRKNEDPNEVLWINDEEKLQVLYQYCKDDTEAEREMWFAIPELSEDEQKLWMFDQRVNDRGFHVDRKLAEAASRISHTMRPMFDAELTKITGGEVTAHTQVARIKKWMHQFCGDVDLDKAAIGELLVDSELPKCAKRVLELRQLGAQAAVSKVDALLQRLGPDDRLRGAFVFHAAGTGRWASRGAQVQNLKRSMTKDLDTAVDLIMRENIAALQKKYPNPLSVIGDCIRSMIKAAPGHTLIGGDFSGIEARVTAWVAGEERKLDVFRAYDAGEGPDPYLVAAADIDGIDVHELAAAYANDEPWARESRQKGKAAELAFGFQGGVNAYRRFTPSGGAALTSSQALWSGGNRLSGGARGKGLSGDQATTQIADDSLTDDEIQRIKRKWRSKHPNIERFWFALDRAASYAVRNPGERVLAGRIAFECDNQPFLRMTLPSGRNISYPNARWKQTLKTDNGHLLVDHPRGRWGVLFKDNTAGQWRDVQLYGGLLCLGADTQVFTTAGWKQIVNIQRSDKVWDGLEWVSHQGVVYRGVKETAALDGVRMTAEHEVLSDHGWVRAAQAQGLHRAKVWLPDRAQGCRINRAETSLETSLRVWKNSCAGKQRICKWEDQFLWMHAQQTDWRSNSDARDEFTPSLLCLAFNESAMLKPQASSLEKLRWTWHHSVRTLAEQFRKFLVRYESYIQAWASSRSEEQRWRIFQSKLSMGYANYKSSQPAEQSHNSNALGRDDTYRSGSTFGHWEIRTSLPHQTPTTHEMVYDLVNCGPRKRFVVRGDTEPFLVHNCENVVSGIARDLLAEAMKRIDAEKFDVCIHIHDECVIEVPKKKVTKQLVKRFAALMMEVPDWAEGLPVVVKPWVNERYTKG